MVTQFPLVRFRRDEFDDSSWYGFVVAQSDQLLVIHRVSDRYDLDGYCVFRRDQIADLVEDFDRADLIRRALRLKGQEPSAPQSLVVMSLRALMESAQATYGVLVINREGVHPDEAEVGTIRMSSEEFYVLRWLDVNAHWENDDRTFRYADVTLVEFAGEYENTLLAVARDREGDG